VRFSADGKFLATGCNRTAQIYDTKTGQKTWLVWDFAFERFFADFVFKFFLPLPLLVTLPTAFLPLLLPRNLNLNLTLPSNSRPLNPLTSTPTHSVLTDESAGKSGDLYIRSVCFSPDGKYLATGAEDKQIRVSFFSLG
jgi:WD40 repeat protein